MKKPGLPSKPRRAGGVSFGPAPVKAVKQMRAAAKTASLAGGWVASYNSGPALGLTEARCFARGTLDSDDRPWAVRGEVPYEDEKSTCGCSVAVCGGVRMQLPEKVFGRNHLEVSHAASGLCVSIDAGGALRRWARLSLDSLDDKRSGRPSWSGWSGDGAKQERVWLESEWSETSTYARREEWDWTYRTDYDGVWGANGGGYCAAEIAAWESRRLVCCGSGPAAPPLAARRGAPSFAEVPDDGDADGTAYRAAAGKVSFERTTKLYEDFLTDLGVSKLTVRLVGRERGWDVRLRWFTCVNPGRVPLRGVPHARLRDTEFRCVGGVVTRRCDERELYFGDGGAGNEDGTGGGDSDSDESDGMGAASLNADVMELRMPRTKSFPVSELRLDGAAPVAAAPAAAPLPPAPPAPPAAAATRFAPTVAFGDDHVTCLAKSPCGTRVAAASCDSGTLVCAAVGTAGLAWTVPDGHPEVEALAFAGPEWLASAGADGNVAVWAAGDGAPVGRAAFTGAVGADYESDAPVVQCVAGGPGGAVAAASGRSVRWFRVDPAAKSVAETVLADPLPTPVAALSFSPDALALAAATAHGGVFVWHAAPGWSAAPSRLECAGSCLAVVASSGGWCAAGCADCTVRLWPEAGGDDPATAVPLTFGGFESKVRSVAADADGGWLAATDGAGAAIAWRLSAAPIGTRALGIDSAWGCRVPTASPAASVALGAGGKLAIGGADGGVVVGTLAGDGGGWVLDGECLPVPVGPNKRKKPAVDVAVLGGEGAGEVFARVDGKLVRWVL